MKKAQEKERGLAVLGQWTKPKIRQSYDALTIRSGLAGECLHDSQIYRETQEGEELVLSSSLLSFLGFWTPSK